MTSHIWLTIHSPDWRYHDKLKEIDKTTERQPDLSSVTREPKDVVFDQSSYKSVVIDRKASRTHLWLVEICMKSLTFVIYLGHLLLPLNSLPHNTDEHQQRQDQKRRDHRNKHYHPQFDPCGIKRSTLNIWTLRVDHHSKSLNRVWNDQTCAF